MSWGSRALRMRAVRGFLGLLLRKTLLEGTFLIDKYFRFQKDLHFSEHFDVLCFQRRKLGCFADLVG